MDGAAARLCVISDTHLSPVFGLFYENYRKVADAVSALQPDRVIHAGDLCVDGAGSEADLAFTAACLRRIEVPLHCIPGNHDIGDTPDNRETAQPIDEERIARYARHFGQGYWAFDIGRWRMIGLDGLVLGSGLAREDAQWAWLEAQLAGTEDRPVGLFLHKPLFLEHRQEEEDAALTVSTAARERLENMFGRVNWRFVLSGHLHQYWRRSVDGIDHIWAPSTAFMSGRLKGPTDPRLGILLLELEEDRHDVTLLRVDGLEERDLDTIKEHGRYQWLRDMPPAPPDAPELSEM